MRHEIVGPFIQDGPAALRWCGMGLSVVGAAVWHSLTSVLASALALMFITDLVLGVLKAIHGKGLNAFDWNRFSRAWVKLAAAVGGIALFTMGDLLLHESGLDRSLTPLTSAALFGMCWGFFWSGMTNLAYFFPKVGDWVSAALKKVGMEEQVREVETTDADQPGTV